MNLVSKELALELNQKWYFTGVPCKKGHIDKIYVNVNRCYQCQRLNNSKYYKNNPEKVSNSSKKSRLKNKERADATARKWVIANKEKVKEIKKRNKLKHKDKYRTSAALRVKERRQNDPIWKANRNISKQIWAFLNGKKAGRSWESIIGRPFESIKQSLESKFTLEINWDNYGSYWEIDHIKPLSWFPNTEQGVIDAWNPSNLQPLEKSMNRSKQNKNALLASELNNKEFIDKSGKTEITDYSGPIHRLQDLTNIKLLHAGMGLSTESAEILDSLKKVIYYGQPLDKTNLIEEMGDIFYYLAMMSRVLNVSFEEIMAINIEKLKARYGDKFTEDKALNRDLDKERKILENK